MSGASLAFVFGMPELKAVLLAVGIISVWAVLRYGRASRRGDDPST